MRSVKSNLPPSSAPKPKWKTAYRMVKSFNRFRLSFNSTMTVDEQRMNEEDEMIRSETKRVQSRGRSPDMTDMMAVDPVYMALKQATGKYSKKKPQFVDNSWNTSQGSLQDSGYEGLMAQGRLGSSPQLGSREISVDKFVGMSPLPPRRAPRLDKSMKSMSLDTPESANPLHFSLSHRPSRTNPTTIAKKLAGQRTQLMAPRTMALQKNGSIEANSMDELEQRSSTSCSPCTSPMTNGSMNSLRSSASSFQFVVTHEYRPQDGHFELLLGDRMTVLHTDDPDWFHGFKNGDRTETMLSFPSTCVAVLHAGESVMKLMQNVSVNLGKQFVRLYRDQVVFVQPDSMHDGCVMVRTEHCTKVICPIQQLVIVNL